MGARPTDPGCSESVPGDFVEPVFDYPHTDPGGGARLRLRDHRRLRRPRTRASAASTAATSTATTAPGKSARSISPTPSAAIAREGLEVDELDSFGEDSCGHLYVASGDGEVSRLARRVAGGLRILGLGPRLETPCLVPPRSQAPSAARSSAAAGRLITAFVSPCEGRRGEPVKPLERTPPARRRGTSTGSAPPASAPASGTAPPSTRRSQKTAGTCPQPRGGSGSAARRR